MPHATKHKLEKLRAAARGNQLILAKSKS